MKLQIPVFMRHCCADSIGIAV